MPVPENADPDARNVKGYKLLSDIDKTLFLFSFPFKSFELECQPGLCSMDNCDMVTHAIRRYCVQNAMHVW